MPHAPQAPQVKGWVVVSRHILAWVVCSLRARARPAAAPEPGAEPGTVPGVEWGFSWDLLGERHRWDRVQGPVIEKSAC